MKKALRIYMLIVTNSFAIVTLFGFILPCLISMPQTEAVILGIFIIFAFIPLFIYINYKQIKNLQK